MTVARPSMPRTLRGEARAEWNRIVPELEGMGVLATIDRALLIRYCTAWGDWVELNDLVEKSGRVIRGRRDALVRNPLWLLRRDAEETVTELGRQLGLTPVARLRSGIVHDRPEPDETPASVLVMEQYKRWLAEPDPREALGGSP